MIYMNYISPKKLHIFSKVCDLKSITKAAESLHMTQPAVSNVIKELENHFELKFIEIKGKKIHINSNGRKLYENWLNIESTYVNLQDNLNAKKIGTFGDIKIGMVSSAKFFIMKKMKNFSKLYPKSNFYCYTYPRNKLIDNILDRKIDIGIITNPSSHPDIHSEKAFKNELVLVCGENDFSKYKKKSISTILQEKFITREKDAIITNSLYKLFDKYDITPNIVLQTNNTDSIKEAVIHNIGIALLPKISVQRELDNNFIKQIRYNISSDIDEKWCIIYGRSHQINEISNKFIKFLEKNEK